MTALALEWFWWIFATFGIVGLIAFWVFAPEAFLLVMKSVFGLVTWILSYRIGCALIAGAICFMVADYNRAQLDEADWKKQVAEFERQQDARDVRIAADTEKWVTKRIADDYMATKGGQADVQEFEQNKPVGECPPVGDRADELRRIAGQTVSKPAKRVPKAPRPSPATEDRGHFRLPGFISGSLGSAGGGQPTHQGPR